MNAEISRAKPLVGIIGGALVGGVIYGLSRSLLPGQLAAGAAIVGLFSGLGARLGGAIGSPAQLRVVVFASLFSMLIGEYFAFAETEVAPDFDGFAIHLLSDGFWLIFAVMFLVSGIFLGVRLLVGGDPLGDILEHAGEVTPPGARGTTCPRCESVQTRRESTGELHCTQCEHRWRV